MAIETVRALLAVGGEPARADLAAATRALAGELGRRYAGGTIEVRVPPYAAVQLRSPTGAGPRHTRGTPPNVVETDPATFIGVVCGDLTWQEARASHRLRCSGVQADEVARWLPLAGFIPPAPDDHHTAIGAAMEGQGS